MRLLYQTNASAIGAVPAASSASTTSTTDATEPDVGGVPNQFLGITPAYLWQTQLHQMSSVDVAEYQRLFSREIGSRLDAKCDKLADAVAIDDIG
ncbi:hypothetical protein K7X08_015124 [Anisodus acutangulus]|uniref:Uncharacterized protein n=1 Tax=Anisodus acutangulus TaxID=402998 RepID=A0A9Q1L651_9SOLA|nr:hypothetical protein K7X08_015124 [Anisodus acutangulus]